MLQAAQKTWLKLSKYFFNFIYLFFQIAKTEVVVVSAAPREELFLKIRFTQEAVSQLEG